MFDCIVTDPPYDMAESARSVSSSEGGRTADTQAEGTVTSATTRGVGAGQNSNTAGSAKTPASSSLRVDGVLSTLLLVASQRLRLGGRLVFFAPHRDRGQDRDKKGRKDVVGTAVSQAAEVHSETEGRGLISEEEEEEGPAALAQIVASAVPAVSVSLSAPPLGAGGAGGGIEQKMSKRKAFKKRAKALLLHPDALQHQRSSSPSPLLSPLSFLPPLPPNLVLVEYHQQVMSPTFSRWLCVIEKVEVEMDGDFIGDVTATMVIDAE